MSGNFEVLVMRGDRASQPAASIPGRLYYVTDENLLERDNGSAWESYSYISFDPSDVTITGTLALSGDISPSQITADTDDYNPTGLSSASTLRLSTDASRNLTGVQGGADGRLLVIHNIGAFDLVLKNENVGSSAANRFALQADITLEGGDSCLLRYDATSSRWRCIGKTPGGTGGGGGGASWTQVISENGASFTNFTGASGTWSSDGTVIKQTDTGATFRRAKHNTKVVTSLVIYEAEIQLRSSGSDRIGGLLVGFDGSGGSGMCVRLNEGADQIQVEADGATSIVNLTFTIAVNTWYKLRVVVASGNASIYVDGTLIGTSGNNSQRSGDATYLGLISYQAEVWWQNIKAWNLDLPA